MVPTISLSRSVTHPSLSLFQSFILSLFHLLTRILSLCSSLSLAFALSLCLPLYSSICLSIYSFLYFPRLCQIYSFTGHPHASSFCFVSLLQFHPLSPSFSLRLPIYLFYPFSLTLLLIHIRSLILSPSRMKAAMSTHTLK